jgi:UDP-N-acetylmuramyl pentapeptide synthase
VAEQASEEIGESEQGTRRIAVLGEMLELGDEAPALTGTSARKRARSEWTS